MAIINLVIGLKGLHRGPVLAPELASLLISFYPAGFGTNKKPSPESGRIIEWKTKDKSMVKRRSLGSKNGCKNLCLKGKYPYKSVSGGEQE